MPQDGPPGALEQSARNRWDARTLDITAATGIDILEPAALGLAAPRSVERGRRSEAQPPW